jgi:hypothetical protein
MREKVEHLNDLPEGAVVFDYNQQVWQKLAGQSEDGCVWFRPGRVDGSRVHGIELPARLLDDGL